MDLYEILTVLHVLAAAVGVGAAAASDSVFLNSIRNRRVSHDQYVLIKASSHVVLAGLGVLVLTGVALLVLDVTLWENAHFQAKMTAVVILLFNGVAFHALVVPFLARHHYRTLPEHMLASKQWMFAVTGAVSGVSWFTALVLAVIGPLDVGYLTIMAVYAGLVAVGAGAGYLLLSHLIFWRDADRDEEPERGEPAATGKTFSMVVLAVLLVLLLGGLAFAMTRA
jgi:hypothetical protein